MDQFIQFHKKPTLKIIGVMPDRSCDCVDMALVEIKNSGVQTNFRLISTYHQSYSGRQKSGILSIIEQEKIPIKEISHLNFYLAKLWADAINKMLKKEKVAHEEIDFISSHGITFYNQSEDTMFIDRKISSMLQLGDPAVLAQLTGIITLGDYRIANLSLTKQEELLIPYVDLILFSKLKKNVLFIKIGDLVNVTFIPADSRNKKLITREAGPGNRLIKQLMERLYELPDDKGGEKAFLGKFSQKMFDYLRKIDTYPKIIPANSTYSKPYGKEFIITLLKWALRRRIPEPDVIHTVTRYIGYKIWQASASMKHSRIDALYAGGGGSHNTFLLNTLADYFADTEILKSGEFGIDEDFYESISVAILGNELIRGNRYNIPGIAGTPKPVLLGKICLT